jgi:hypothetical protein
VDALETCLTKLKIGPYCENNKEVGVVFKALESIQRKFDASQVEHKVVLKKVFIIGFRRGHDKTQSLLLTIRWNCLIGLVDNAWDTFTSICFSSMSPCSLIS